MKGFKLSAVVLGVLLLSVPAFAQEKSQKSSSEKTMSATGVVSAVAADSLTIKAKSGEVKFAVDKDTHVQATGASRKTAALKSDQKTLQLTEYVKVGDSVTVKYHETGATKHASDVVVRSALPGTKK